MIAKWTSFMGVCWFVRLELQRIANVKVRLTAGKLDPLDDFDPSKMGDFNDDGE